jgi:hypothetical protein
MKRNFPHPVFSPHSRFVAAFALMLLLGTAAAQRNTGILAGRTSDRQGAVLPGARVTFAPGDHTLTISYVGFATFTQQVTVPRRSNPSRGSHHGGLGQR